MGTVLEPDRRVLLALTFGIKLDISEAYFPHLGKKLQ